jgi:TetR/AcrR family transcriptional regulator
MGIKERRVREREARREEIINAAEKVFFGKGLAEATMDEIAEAAELSKGTLYLYYKSKEDLYLGVTMRGMDIMFDLFERAVTAPEPVLKRIANLGEAYYEYFEKHRDYFRMFYFFENPQYHSQVSPEMLEQCKESDQRVWGLVKDLIQTAIDEGMLHEGLDPMEVGVMLWSNSNGLMRLIDRQDHFTGEALGVDLSALLRKSNLFLVEAMMTEKAKQLFPSALLYHQPVEQAQRAQINHREHDANG